MSTIPHRILVCVAIAALSSAAQAGPPYLTDDPQPTDQGHWEIYNFVLGSHDGGGVGGETGVDLNYGAAKDLQLTAVLPIAFETPDSVSLKGLRGGTGIIELAAKFKVLHADDKSWLPDVSIFPRLYLPTDHRFGTARADVLIPVWAEKDLGPWQIFGGGGYELNPGSGNRNFWQGGIALNRTMTDRLQLGGEVFAQSRDGVNAPGFVAVNLALTYRVIEHWSLLTSAGPTWAEGGGRGQVFYVALKADY